MRIFFLLVAGLAAIGCLLSAEAQAQQTTHPKGTQKAANGYHRTSNTRAEARAGAHARHNRSKRRREPEAGAGPAPQHAQPTDH